MRHDEARDGIGAWVFGACTPAEAERIDRHVSSCTECRYEADRLRSAMAWIGVAYPLAPPPGLRERVLSSADRFAVRVRRTYAAQVEAFTFALSRLSPDMAIARHGTVGGLVAHLSGNDRSVLQVLRPGVAVPGWRAQADELLKGLAAADGTVLRREVRLAGAAGLHRPLRAALVQRVFETWTHTDDLRVAAGQQRRAPSADAVRMIVDFAVRLIPVAMHGLGRAHPGRTAALVLTGVGSGRWLVPLAPDPPDESAPPSVTVITDAVAFCRLMAGRCAPADLPVDVRGNGQAAGDLLHVASTVGCDFDE